MVFGAAGVDDPTSRELKPRRNHGLTQLERRETPRAGFKRWSRSSVDRPAYATARDQVLVRRIDDRIAIELLHDIAMDYSNLCA